MKTRKVTRAYKLKVYGNDTKTDTARYTYSRFMMFADYWIGRLFFNGNKRIQTVGMGTVADSAQHKCRGIIRALRAAEKETDNKVNVPDLKNLGAYAAIEKSKDSSFDFWVRISNMWTKRDCIRLPLKAHKALNKALKNHWEMSSHCEFKWINGEMFVYVFVSKEVPVATPKDDCIGADVGINKSVTFSDGHKGIGLSAVIRQSKDAQRERYRQRTKFGQIQRLKKGRKDKTWVKQILDREAKELVRRSRTFGCNAVVESRKILANLRCGRLSRWARCYFAERVEVLCKEESVFFLEVNPWNSSKECHSCKEIGERSGEVFVCKNSSCPEYLIEADADVNAARVLRGRGRTVVEKYFSTAIIRARPTMQGATL